MGEKTMKSVGQIQNVAVIGTGTMGPGIAQIFAQGGLKVVLYDIKEDQLEKASKAIQNNLKIFQETGFLTSKEVDEVRKRILSTSNLDEAVKKADFVLEAVPEILTLELAGRAH